MNLFDIGQAECGEFSESILCRSIQTSWSSCYALWIVVMMEVGS